MICKKKASVLEQKKPDEQQKKQNKKPKCVSTRSGTLLQYILKQMAWLDFTVYIKIVSSQQPLSALPTKKNSLWAIWAVQYTPYTMYQRQVFFFLFFNRRYSLVSFRLHQHILMYKISILRLCQSPIQYAVFSLQNQLTKCTTHNTLLFLYLAKDSLSHRQRQMGSNMGLEANCITLKLPPKQLSCLNQAKSKTFKVYFENILIIRLHVFGLFQTHQPNYYISIKQC